MLAYRCVNENCRHYGKAFNGEPESKFCKCGDGYEVFQAPDEDEIDQIREELMAACALNEELLGALRITASFLADVYADDGRTNYSQWKETNEAVGTAIAKAEGRS